MTFSYSVFFKESNIEWGSRWDPYIESGDTNIHWFSIIICFACIICLIAITIQILGRTLKSDIESYIRIGRHESSFSTYIDTGWKLLKNDVFIHPKTGLLLCSIVGIGVQLVIMLFITFVTCFFGIISPERRGGMVTIMIFLYIFLSLIGGLSQSFLAKSMKYNFNECTLATIMSFFIPSIIFGLYFILNLLLWISNSSGVVPLNIVIIVIILWIGILYPLAIVGTYIGARFCIEDGPPYVSAKVSRNHYKKRWYHNWFFVSLGGIIPFISIFLELRNIMISIWGEYYFVLFGFLCLVLISLVILCGCISIASTYLLLNTGNPYWWWRSFWVSGSSGIYVMIFAIFYYAQEIKAPMGITTILYFGHMLAISGLITIIAGTIGFLASFIFVKKIYSLIKSD